MTSSSIPDVKAALKTAFDGAAGLSGVAISWGPQVPPQEEMVEIGFRAEADRSFAGIRRAVTPLNESPSIQIVVSVLRTPKQGGSPVYQAAEERMWELVEACEDAYRADPTLGGVVGFGLFKNIRQEPWTLDQKQGSKAFITLTANEARLE